jgi:hypothetical protein
MVDGRLVPRDNIGMEVTHTIQVSKLRRGATSPRPASFEIITARVTIYLLTESWRGTALTHPELSPRPLASEASPRWSVKGCAQDPVTMVLGAAAVAKRSWGMRLLRERDWIRVSILDSSKTRPIP